MENSINSNNIIKRIQSGEINNYDLEYLRQLLQKNDNETLQQLSKFNVSIDDGKKIHIGDRNYFNWSDEAIQAVVEVVQQGKAVAVFNPTGKVTIYNYNNYYREETTTVPDEATEETDNLPCPYRGLFTFGLEDAEYFFGRDVFIEELYQATQTKRFIPVLGASGSGKSSVIFAGLVPRLLTEENWLFTHFRPGKDPFYALAQALIPLYTPDLNQTQLIIQADELSEYLKDTKKTNQLLKVFEKIQHNHPQNRTLLIADQFEEIYTLCSDEQTRRKFLDILLNTFQSFREQSSLSTVLVATMRADFLGNVLAYRPLADVLRNGDIKIPSMNEKELREIIEKPAQKLGVYFEEGLVERIYKDIDKEPGNLPLLEFALTKLWKKRQGKQLTHKAYKEIGQVSGALTRYADEKYRQLKPKEQQQVHRIFVQLVRPGEGTEDTRRVATKAELNENNWNLVKKLADARLVVTNRRVVTREQENNSEPQQKTEQETVEVVHEALIRSWGKLKGWMQEDREFRAWQERMRGTMLHWQEMHRDEGLLLRRAALAQAEEKLKERQDELSEAEQEFIQLSQEQQKREHKQKQRLRQQIFGGLVVFSVIVSLLSVVLEFQRRRAFLNEQRASLKTLDTRLVSEEESLDIQLDILKLVQRTNNTTLEMQATDPLQKIVNWLGEKEINILHHQDYVASIAFSSNGQIIATASRDNTVKLWKPDGTLVQTLQGHSDFVNAVAFSPDDKIIATASWDNTVKLWKSDGTLVQTLQGHSNFVNAVAFSPDGQIIASASRDNTVKLWKPDGTLVDTLEGHEDRVNAVAFSPNGQIIASASYDNTVKLWKPDGTLVQTLQGHSDFVNAVAFSPDGNIIASASSDNTVKLWKADGTVIQTLQGHQSFVASVAFSSNGQIIATASRDNTVKLWKVDGNLIQTLQSHQAGVNAVAFSPDGNIIASASADTRVKLWKANDSLAHTLQDHKDRVYDVVFSPNGNIIASASRDNTVKLWKVDGTLIQTLQGHDNYVYGVAFSPNGNIIASASWDNTVKLWKVDGTLIQTLQGDEDRLYDVVFSPNGNIIASASSASAGRDNTVKLWKIDGTPIQSLQGHKARVNAVAFSPNGNIIASASLDNTVKLWKADGTLVRTLKSHKDAVFDVAFSPDGNTIATASSDNTVKLWKSDGTLVDTFKGHQNTVFKVAFSPNGNIIASASRDNTVKLWKADGTLVNTLENHQDDVIGIAFSPRGNIIATGSADQTIKLWYLNQDEMIAHACKWINDYLKNNPNVTAEERRFCGVEASATAIFLQGEQLAAEGYINKAIDKFQQAVKLDSNFSLKKAAVSFLIVGKQLLENQKFDQVILAYDQAQKWNSKLKISALTWNELCWQGGLHQQAEKVMFACEKAVKLAPENGNIKDSRGLARALTGDFYGAIEDFKAFIEFTNDAKAKAQRQAWVESLKKNENSFLDEELKKMQ